MTAPGAKYAKPERERRFVLAAVPAGANTPREIVDRYIIGTRLRLRSVTSTEDTTLKLGQKIRPAPDDPGLVMHTTMYVSHDEYELLAALPAHCLRKTRRALRLGDHSMSIDEFRDELDGLITAEIDFADAAAMEAFVPPSFCVAEVSRDERFTGGRLAAADRTALLPVLAEVSGLRLPS